MEKNTSQLIDLQAVMDHKVWNWVLLQMHAH